MKLEFDFEQITLTEFGIGRDDGNGQAFVVVPVDEKVQKVLRDIALSTWKIMQDGEEKPTKYEPSDKHGNLEYLYLPLVDDMAAGVRDLHQAVNLPMNAMALTTPGNLFCYFVRLTDGQQRKLTALRRASQFKGIVKNKGRLIRLLNDTLQIVEDTIFKLDSDFDLLIDAQNVHILRPSGFEFAGKLQQAILDAVPGNVATIKAELTFIQFDRIEQYATKHPRAARYLASIRGQAGMKDIDKTALKKLCKSTGVEISESKGRVIIADGHEMAFLQVMDRRRYQLELVKDKPEKFVAASRKPIK
ncbi:MAG: Kiwa anti-phage protein KwaB-like domain-containing protein [Burkholderiaceae bacterium]